MSNTLPKKPTGCNTRILSSACDYTLCRECRGDERCLRRVYHTISLVDPNVGRVPRVHTMFNMNPMPKGFGYDSIKKDPKTGKIDGMYFIRQLYPSFRATYEFIKTYECTFCTERAEELERASTMLRLAKRDTPLGGLPIELLYAVIGFVAPLVTIS